MSEIFLGQVGQVMQQLSVCTLIVTTQRQKIDILINAFKQDSTEHFQVPDP